MTAEAHSCKVPLYVEGSQTVQNPGRIVINCVWAKSLEDSITPGHGGFDHRTGHQLDSSRI